MIRKLNRLFSKRNKGGFTLVEVIISTALLGILIIGVLLFMTPVFSMVESNEGAAKADRAASTMEVYLSKSLRNALYIKVFDGAAAADASSTTGDIYKNADYEAMRTFINTGNNKDNYQINCISIKYVEDTNPRNNSIGSTAKKYMLFNETVDPTQFTVDPAKSALIFDQSFYEDIYPAFEITHMEVEFDASGNVIPETTPPGATPPTVDKTLTPGLIIDINIYKDEAMNSYDRIFSGKSIVQVNNIKSTAINSGGEYKIYDNHTVNVTSFDTYIFYISRKPKVVTPAGP